MLDIKLNSLFEICPSPNIENYEDVFISLSEKYSLELHKILLNKYRSNDKIEIQWEVLD
jgi:hypothetical protein